MSFEFARLWALVLLPLPLLSWRLLPPFMPRAALPVPASIRAHLNALAVRADTAPATGVPWLAAAGWVALVLALAGPQLRGADLNRPTGRDVVIAIDLSASMADSDMVWNGERVERFRVVRALLGSFIESRAGDRLALIAFGSEAFLISPLTFDTGAVADLLDELTIGLPGRKTDLGQAIGLTIQTMAGTEADDRVLIVLSDGHSNSGALSAQAAARLAADRNITIHAVGFAGALIAEDVAGLRLIAEATGGRYFEATTPDLLRGVNAEIARLEPTAIDGDVPYLAHDLSWLPLSVALVVLAVLVRREVGL